MDRHDWPSTRRTQWYFCSWTGNWYRRNDRCTWADHSPDCGSVRYSLAGHACQVREGALVHRHLWTCRQWQENRNSTLLLRAGWYPGTRVWLIKTRNGTSREIIFRVFFYMDAGSGGLFWVVLCCRRRILNRRVMFRGLLRRAGDCIDGSQLQRQATKDAEYIYGMNVLRFTNELTKTAITCRLDKKMTVNWSFWLTTRVAVPLTSRFSWSRKTLWRRRQRLTMVSKRIPLVASLTSLIWSLVQRNLLKNARSGVGSSLWNSPKGYGETQTWQHSWDPVFLMLAQRVPGHRPLFQSSGRYQQRSRPMEKLWASRTTMSSRRRMTTCLRRTTWQSTWRWFTKRQSA